MKLPNADHAVIVPEKIRDYLLNPTHRRGAAKARLLLGMGYRRRMAAARLRSTPAASDRRGRCVQEDRLRNPF